jgi:gentisate 1,2-dioxygenase
MTNMLMKATTIMLKPDPTAPDARPPIGEPAADTPLPLPAARCLTSEQVKAYSWAAGWGNEPYRYNANQIFVVLRGAGTSDIAQRRFEWAFGDVFVAPLGARVAHTVSADAVVVGLSDERLMKHCGYYEVEACR